MVRQENEGEFGMSESQKIALISVSDKEGIAPFAAELVKKGFQLISSGGTYRHLTESGLEAHKVSERTGFPEILDGRVKTLHPKIHGALLARYDMPSHTHELEQHAIDRIHLVVVNLYPFAQTIAREGATPEDAIEQIDIGGPTMVRASAKNFQHLTILTDPSDYEKFLEEVADDGLPSLSFRLGMAQKAFHHTFAYDMKIADYLDRVTVEDGGLKEKASGELPETFRLNAKLMAPMRYGENPHQRAAFYAIDGAENQNQIKQHQGKQLSYNNLVDMEAAWRCVLDFEQPTAVVVKHTNPCGVASHSNLETAFRRARQVDPVSAFGGIMAFNREVDAATAAAIKENFSELVIAPSFSEDALKAFRKRKNLRVLELNIPKGGEEAPKVLELKRLDNGLLIQDRDETSVPFEQWRQVSKRSPTEAEIEALKCAWVLVKHVKSNAIVYANAEGAVGVGAGQMSRVDSAKIAILKADEANLEVRGSAMASDAFFPFRDSIDAAAEAGVKAVVEPGGSVRDEEVIQAADEHGIALFFTGRRHFKH